MPCVNLQDNVIWLSFRLTKNRGAYMSTGQSTSAGRLREIAVSPRCDARLGRAIQVFSWKLAPYSLDSRRYSIIRLMRELIDPEWDSLQARFSALSVREMDFAWANVQRERLIFEPCRGKIQGSYVLSEITRRYGFEVFGRFIQYLAKKCRKRTDFPQPECFDALLELRFACQAKLSERKIPNAKDARKTINARRAHKRPTCRFCGQVTELRSHLDGAPLPAGYDNDDSRPRLSAQYCQLHKPKNIFDIAVRPEYLKAKRSQSIFDLELERLERQVLGGPHAPWARSGNQMVDEFFLTLVRLRLPEAIFTDPTIRNEARFLVDEKMSNTKKELVMHLAHGLTQTEAAKQLGISRQAVFKALRSIHVDFRFDLQLKHFG